ncbi:hypothetical protein [Kribbella capetownensis]|uniref:hypothetical protein n=1 Tax=Kribbella capetownensis TaxID=1572659 RepID=UPI001EDFE935|nr:hypothetical protein [Kribbella capetownensis]
MSVVSMVTSEVVADLASPALTAMTSPGAALGAAASRVLLERLADDGSSTYEQLFPCTPEIPGPAAALEAGPLSRVVAPTVRPTSVLLVLFIWTWNEFFIPLVMLMDASTQTVPLALASLWGDRLMDATTTNAGALISLLPTVVFFLIFQRTLTRGVTVAAVK